MRMYYSFFRHICFITLLFFISGLGLAQEAQLKKRVAVFSFEDKTNHRYRWWSGQPVGEGMADMLVTALVKSGKYSVIEREELEQVMKEQALGLSGSVTQQSAAKVGQLLGVELAIFGAVTEYGLAEGSVGGALKQKGFGLGVKTSSATVAIDVRFVNTSTGEILSAENVRKQESKKGLSISTEAFDFNNKQKFDESLVGKACRDAIEQVVVMVDDNMAKIPWQGKVVKADDTVIINAGALAGIQVGQQFVVYRPGEDLIDPDTGLSLGSEEARLGVIRVTTNSIGNGKASNCEIIEGGDFQRGDIVRAK
ncbi:hypothetical protein JXO59_03595 [candidate division KSB1 bacterium]|nr:hypothetical protein [candidate division KSB1 bacterium]